MNLNKRKCPRCQGPVTLEKDNDGWYVRCFMCGWHHDLSPMPSHQRQPRRIGEIIRVGDGCNVSLSCFNCPLPDCQYEASSTRQIYERDQRIAQVFEQYQDLGVSTAAELTAKAVNIAVRTVYRTLARLREQHIF